MTDDSNVTQGADVDDAPKWARDAITRANNEAAERRVQLRELEKKYEALNNQLAEAIDAKTAAERAVEEKNRELLKLRIALDAGVPGERVRSIAERLKGETEDELKADAAALIKEFGLDKAQAQRLVDPTQARGGKAAPVPNTPQAEFAQMWAGLNLNKR